MKIESGGSKGSKGSKGYERRPPQKKWRMRPRVTGLAIQVARCAHMFVHGRGRGPVDVAVEELTTPSAQAVEDRSVPDPLSLQIPPHAAQNFLLSDPSFL